MASSRVSFVRRLLALLGVAGLFGVAAPAHPSIDTSRQELETRVLAVRAVLNEHASLEGKSTDPARALAQWFNWPNWNNWSNWPNWNKWGNWFNR